jgi:death-on-curing protein
MVKYLTLEDILRLHFQVIEDYGGSHGVRDQQRIKSVVLAPQQAVFGEEQYPDLYEKAAVYMRNIIADHAFSDGNKRSGTTVAAVFLDLNGVELTALPKELEDFAVQVAVEHLDVPTIAAWLRAHSKKS